MSAIHLFHLKAPYLDVSIDKLKQLKSDASKQSRRNEACRLCGSQIHSAKTAHIIEVEDLYCFNGVSLVTLILYWFTPSA